MGDETDRAKRSRLQQETLTCVTWNIAAINNNPFEYWITHDDPAYLKLMADVQNLVDAPTAEQDAEISSIFPDAIFEELCSAMVAEGWAGVDKTRRIWREDFSKRRILSGFLKSKDVGAKRLASMPDRMTNTINLAGGGTACRPSVINNYMEPLPDIPTWWKAWRAFMFEAELELPGNGGGVKKTKPCTLLGAIPKAKYPAITSEEEAISIPLQALCCAIFDAILVHMLNAVAPSKWYSVKAAMCAALSKNKSALTLSILEEQYADADVIFLQECAAGFAKALVHSEKLDAKFHVLLPAALDGKRDQNSVILAAKRTFDGSNAQEISADVNARAEAAGAAMMAGDVYAVLLPSAGPAAGEVPWLLAAFHGDTNGLATVPFLEALHATREALRTPRPRILLGLDANAHCVGSAGKCLGSDVFVQAVAKLGLQECWAGLTAEAPKECCTTFNARTYLQPQLSKAVGREKAATDPHTDRNPKDYVVFDKGALETVGTPARDNTGVRGAPYEVDAPFPTLRFPSDHAVLMTVLRLVS